MTRGLGLTAGLASILLPVSAASAHDRCGHGHATGENISVTVDAVQSANAPPRLGFAQVEAKSGDGAFALQVSYQANDVTLGAPKMLFLYGYMPLERPAEAVPKQIAWRVGNGSWTNPGGHWSTPARMSSDSPDPLGFVFYKLAQIPPFPMRTEMLEALLHGARFAMRRLAADGQQLSQGTVAYPAAGRLEPLYAAARTAALADLRACGDAVAVPPPVVFRR